MRCGCSSVRSTALHAARSSCTGNRCELHEVSLTLHVRRGSPASGLRPEYACERTLNMPDSILSREAAVRCARQSLHIVEDLLDALQRSITHAASFGSLWPQSNMMLVTCVMTCVSGQASCQLSVTPSKASSASADVDAARPRLEAGATSATSLVSSGSPAIDDSYAAACRANRVDI
jgi:hypothetical protein